MQHLKNFPMRILSILCLAFFATGVANAQTILISDGGFAFGCNGYLYDSGGDSGAGYGPGENFTLTICSDQSSGTGIQLSFLTFNLMSGDVLMVYDGDMTSSPLIDTFTSTSPPPTISSSFANTSGCLTLVWTSGASSFGQFNASLQCFTPCAPPTAVGTMSEVTPALICQGETLNFDGSGSTAATGFSIAQYRWDFGQGNLDTVSGATVAYTFMQPGQYNVQLRVIDNNGCANANSVVLPVLVSTTPVFTSATVSDTVICLGESVTLGAGVQATTWSGAPVVDFGAGVYLPDQLNMPFISTIDFSGFASGATVNSIDDIVSICVSMEHSYMGDLRLSITCPNGTMINMHNQGGGGTFIGDALDTEVVPPVPGICLDYCWTPTATNGTFAESSAFGVSPNVQPSTVEIGDQVLIPGNYTSVQPLSNLIGCPLNGTWTFTSVDNLGIDDGFLCSWSVQFDPSLYPALTTFTPVLSSTSVDSTFWSGDGVVFGNDPLTATATPTAEGLIDYTFSVIDNFGCTYDTTITVMVNPGIPGPINITGTNSVCAGGIAFLNAPTGYDTYEWNNASFGPNISGGPGTYIVTVALGDCTLPSEPFTVIGVPSPNPVISGPGFSCGTGQAVLSTTQNYTTYQWSNNSNAPTVTVGNGSYSVIVTNAEGCSATSAPFQVQLGNNPTAAYTSDPLSPQEPGVTVDFFNQSTGNGSAIAGYEWILDFSGASTNVTNPSYSYPNPGTYPVTLIVTNVDGCTDTLFGSFVIVPLDIVVPNVFTPNNDNVNEALVFQNLEFYKNNLTVYNRWGNKVFEKSNYQNTWRATDVPDGTYYYVLSVPDAAKTEYTGHVTIVR